MSDSKPLTTSRGRPRRWSAAMRRHQRRVWPTLAVYALVLAATLWLFGTHPPQGPLKYFVALAPTVPLVAVIWLYGRYLYEETDEFMRWHAVLSVLVATGLTLSICEAWGFLEVFAGLPHVPLYHAATIFVVAQGLSSAVVGWRYR